MGFCRRCGEIVSGVRCQCGGTAVAPVVPWNQLKSTEQSKDKWSNTYVVKKPPILPTRTQDTPNIPLSSPSKRFTRPASTTVSGSKQLLGTCVTEHIATTTSQTIRPPSPLKHSIIAHPESDILPSMTPYDTTLSKVYGSVLQPKESLTTHSCSICVSPFSPDATIYPDPSYPISTSRFLCRSCFTNNGGSKGTCPTCGRPVLILKSEGGYVQAAGKYWHKICFTCEGCFKNIGASPMVDLLGRPSCVECFDNCLNRSPTPKRSWSSNTNSPRVDKGNLGGMSGSKSRSREGSPAIEELEQRLGIVKSREASPALEELSQRLSMIGKDIGSKYASSGNSPITSPLLDRSRVRRNSRPESDSMTSGYERLKNPEYDRDSFASQSITSNHSSRNISPVRRQRTGSPAPTQEAIDEMKQRFLKGSPSLKSSIESPSLKTTSPLRISRSSTSLKNTRAPKEPKCPLSPVIPPTPDLVSDCSDSTTQSSVSCPDSPPSNDDPFLDDIFNVSKVFGRGYGTRYTKGDFLEGAEGAIMEETNSQLGTPTRTPKSIIDLVPFSAASSKDSSLTKGHLGESPRSVSQASTIPPVKPASSICASCQNPLFSKREGGGYINVPGDWEGDQSKSYHNNCFTCKFCHDPFEEDKYGKAIFVKVNGHPYHVNCAPATKHYSASLKSIKPMPLTTPSPVKSPTKPPLFTKFDQPPLLTPFTPGNISLPRFGSRTSCPGCHQSVSPMEPGVIPGPQGTRWHVVCLVCGGKKERLKVSLGRNEKKDIPGCGKRLDSGAKTDGEGGVWCRECLLLLGVGGSPQASPTRAPLQPSYTGSTNKIMIQHTGTTTIARQFTGIGGGDPGLFRQLTGGGLSPTRSISPTKQLGMMGSAVRPRPKSVIGMRNTKSIDEGRGMYLVRQMTGSTSTSG